MTRRPFVSPAALAAGAALLACVAVLLAALPSGTTAQTAEGAVAAIPGPAVGEIFPDALAAPDQHGEPQTLAALYGPKGAAVFFVRSADWCPFCQRQLAELNARRSDFEALGFAVVSVSVDDVAEIRAFAEAQSIGYTMLADPAGDINEALGIRDTQYPVGSAAFGVPRPIVYLIDRDGRIRAHFMEPTYRTRPELDAVLAAASE